MKRFAVLLGVTIFVGCVFQSTDPPPRRKITSGPDANLFHAVFKGDLTGVKSAIKMGANVNARQYGMASAMFMSDATPLYTAVLYNHIEILRCLLEHGADPTIPNAFGDRPIDLAKRKQRNEIERLLARETSNRDREVPRDTPLPHR